MWPPLSESSISGLLRHFGVGSEVWAAFVVSAGDPGEDLRPLASLPKTTFTECVTATVLTSGRRLTVMEASQLGLVYRAAKRWAFVESGGAVQDWKDQNPWEETAVEDVTKASVSVTSTERKLKYGHFLDQQDEGEFICFGEDMRAHWYNRYVEKMGDSPRTRKTPR